MSKGVIALLVAVLLVFAVIVSLTGIVGTYFGKTAEMIILVGIAVILIIMLICDRNKKE